MKRFPRFPIFIELALLVAALSLPLSAQVRTMRGQTVYVPVYSHIYYGDRERDFILLSATLSIRNTDMAASMTVLSATLLRFKGEPCRTVHQPAVTMRPLESVRYIVRESDARGGSGANFIVRWRADSRINEPVIESVMIGVRDSRGYRSPRAQG
jgi:hypothetical protein